MFFKHLPFFKKLFKHPPFLKKLNLLFMCLPVAFHVSACLKDADIAFQAPASLKEAV